MKGLLRLLAEYESPLTADFQRVYGLRLRDVVLERTPSEVGDLVLWLPSDSAFRVRYGEKSETDAAKRWAWSDENELLLSLVNLTIAQTHILRQVNSTKTLKAPDLLESPREGQKPSRTRTDADTTARAMLAAVRARKGN